MKIIDQLSRNAISALIVLSWASILFVPLRWSLPGILIVILIAMAIGAQEDRTIAMVSLFTIAIYSWYGMRHVENEVVHDAFAIHRSVIGCSRFDKFMAFSHDRALQAKLPKPTEEESAKCGQDYPAEDEYAEFALKMEKRGWGKYQVARDD